MPQAGLTSSVRVASNTGNLQKLGYRFDGWNTLANGTAVPGVAGGTGTAYAAGDTLSVSADTTLYAIWTAVPTFTLSYSGNSQTGGSVPQAVTTSDGSVVLSANVNSMYRTGYTFNGWNTRADGTGTHYAVGESFPISANTTIYVDWLRDSYTVTYNSNGATAGTAPSVTSGSGTLNLAQNTGNLSKTGYIFSGWNSAADGSGTSVAVGGTFTPSQNTTMFAKWITYTVTYNTNGATSGSAPSPQSSVTSLTLASNSGNLAKTNFYFNGWNTNNSGTGTAYNEGDTYSPTANITLYASWSNAPIYLLTFDANGATSGTSPALYRGLSATIGLPQNSGNLAKTGYTFRGWNTQADGLGTGYVESASYGVSRTETLYAEWLLIQHTLTYSPNGATAGTTPNAVTQVPGNLTTALNSGALAKSGYNFGGWNTRADGSGTSYSPGSVLNLNADQTLYAIWNRIPSDPPVVIKPPTIPQVEAISKNVFSLSGGKLSITGSNLTGVESVLLNGKPVKIELKTDGEISVVLPKMPAGDYELTVIAGTQKFTIASRIKAMPNKVVRISQFFGSNLKARPNQTARALAVIKRVHDYEKVVFATGLNSKRDLKWILTKENQVLRALAAKWSTSQSRTISLSPKSIPGRSAKDLVIIFIY